MQKVWTTGVQSHQFRQNSTAEKSVFLYNIGILFGNLIQLNKKLYTANFISDILGMVETLVETYQGAGDNCDIYASPRTAPTGTLIAKVLMSAMALHYIC